jgi:hypothetical protein
MGKCSNAFFSETTNMIKAKLNMNVHWMVIYKIFVFGADRKSNMAAKKHKSGRGPSSEHFWQVWLISVQRFQRRRFKCEKIKDDGLQVMTKAYFPVPFYQTWTPQAILVSDW